MSNIRHNSLPIKDATIPDWNLSVIVEELRDIRKLWRYSRGGQSELSSCRLPSTATLKTVVENLSHALFPVRLGQQPWHGQSEDFYVGHTLDKSLNALLKQVQLELHYSAYQKGHRLSDVELRDSSIDIVRKFAASLPRIRRSLDKDALAAFKGDPAANSVDAVLLCHPGIAALIHHRMAFVLYTLGTPIVARMISEQAHSITGIDIHPGANIGDSFFIDHGTGVVIGETAIIGSRVRIYQAVTLGAKSFPADETGNLQKGLPRHPIVEDEVVIYAGATVLGRITIGRGSIIGGNVWITKNIPPYTTIAQTSLEQNKKPDYSNSHE